MLAGQQHELLVLSPAPNPRIYQATYLSAGGALALVFWDALLTLDGEVDHIWSKPGWGHVKWIYLFSKWFGVVNQICIQIWYSFLGTYFPVSMPACEALYIFETVTFLLLQLCLDAVLILRIWAIHQRRRRYIAIAIVLVFSEVLSVTMTQANFLSKSTIDGRCIVLHTPAATSCIVIAIMVSQSILLSLTYRGKYLMQPAARRSKVAAVVVRDGKIVLGVVTGILSAFMLYLLFNQVVLNVLFPWMPVVPALLTPRMILNMHMAAEPTESMLELTTLPSNDMESTSMGGGYYEY